MELSEWVRKDMTGYIKQYEKNDSKKNTVRPEDSAQIAQIDYLQRIDMALHSNRLHEAKRLFDELKKRFHKIPESHEEERKRTYQMLQKAYRRIYDFVEDKHKTHTILRQATVTADVFDSSVPSQMSREAQVTEKMPVDFSKPEEHEELKTQAIVRHHKGAAPGSNQSHQGSGNMSSQDATQNGGEQFTPPNQMSSPTIQIQNQQQPKTAREYLAYLKQRGMEAPGQGQMGTNSAPVNIINITPNQLEDAPLDEGTKNSVAEQLGMSREEKKSHLPGFEPMKLHEDIKKPSRNLKLPPPPMNPASDTTNAPKPHEDTIITPPQEVQEEPPRPPQKISNPNVAMEQISAQTPQQPSPVSQKPVAQPVPQQMTPQPLPQQPKGPSIQQTPQTAPQNPSPQPIPQAQSSPSVMPNPQPKMQTPRIIQQASAQEQPTQSQPPQIVQQQSSMPATFVPPSPRPKPRILRKQEPQPVQTPAPKQQEIAPRPMPPPLPMPVAKPHPAKQHVQEAKQQISQGEIEKAQQNLLQARKRLHQVPSAPIKQEVQEAEHELAQKIPARRKEPNDGELFSNLYLKGIHALNNQDYASAARYFQQRVQQAPGDRAARIRLYETLEALHGTNA